MKLKNLLARSMVMDKSHITACCHEALTDLACFWFITILLLLSKNYVDVVTTHRCSGLD